jgi:hypothetical protein
MVKNLISAAKIEVSNFVLKKVFKKMMKLKILQKSKNSKTRYETNKDSKNSKVPTSKTLLKQKRKSQKSKKLSKEQLEDKKFRSKFKRLAQKMLRKGKTIEFMVYEHLSIKDGHWKKKYTFNQVKAYLKSKHVKISNFILLKVLERLRKKKILKLKNGKNIVTGKKIKKSKKSKRSRLHVR